MAIQYSTYLWRFSYLNAVIGITNFLPELRSNVARLDDINTTCTLHLVGSAPLHHETRAFPNLWEPTVQSGDVKPLPS